MGNIGKMRISSDPNKIYTRCPKKKYTSLNSKIFVQRTGKSVKLVSFVRQDLNLGFDI